MKKKGPLLVIGDNEARPQYLQGADLRCVGHVCSLPGNVLLLPESYRRLPAETRWKPLSPPPYTARAQP